MNKAIKVYRPLIPLIDYNCGGLALRTYNWVTPYIDELTDDYDAYTQEARDLLIECLIDDGYDDLEIENEIAERDAEQLMETYPFLERVELKDTTKEDIVIAYRVYIQVCDGCCCDSDFHFKVRFNGYWFEKMGNEEVHLCQLKPNESWYGWNAVYSSKIIYFKDTRKDKTP